VIGLRRHDRGIEVASDIEPLSLDDFRAMRARWQRDLDMDAMERIVRAYPGRSVWSPKSGDVVFVGPWRHRDEISTVVAMRAGGDSRQLLHHAIGQSRERAAKAFVILEWDQIRRPGFYHHLGLQLLDEILPFEIEARPGPESPVPDSLEQFHRFAGPNAAELVEVDHAAFPWLWWNSEREFESYLSIPGVEIWTLRSAGRLAGYVGFTSYGEWGHIDRVAVHPWSQRQGIGRHLVTFAVQRLRSKGASTVGLSTQRGNWRSQRLYHQVGFQRSAHNAYAVYGVIYDDANAG
jgi:ribosomal protein S18 acetylase RimI-like enzyme